MTHDEVVHNLVNNGYLFGEIELNAYNEK